jgi:hypothetical protein
MYRGLIAAILLASAQTAEAQVSDASTLDGKVVTGYQGWFMAPGDGNPPGVGWRHWSRSTTDIGPGLYTVDMWPDVSEYADTFIAPGVTIDYYDSGTGTLMLQYDAASAVYKNGPTIQLTNTNTWQQETLQVSDAYFGNRQNGGGDFRVFLDTGVTRYLDVIEVSTSP